MHPTTILLSPQELLALQATEPVVVIDTRDADTYANVVKADILASNGVIHVIDSVILPQ